MYLLILLEDSIAICVLRKEGRHNAEIAHCPGFHPCSIGRGIRRNSCLYDGTYRYSSAREYTNLQHRNSSQDRRHSHEQCLRVEEQLTEDRSGPEQVSGNLGSQHEFAISHGTIHRHGGGGAGKAVGGNWRQHENRYRKRHNSRDPPGRQLDKCLIGEGSTWWRWSSA